MDLVASALGLVGKVILKQRIKIKKTVLYEIEVVFILLSGNLTGGGEVRTSRTGTQYFNV